MSNTMREILFRGKRVNNEKWVEGYYVPIGGKYHYILTGKLDITQGYSEFERFSIVPETVDRFTGLTDKNGAKIFEGDIVSKKDEVYGRVFGAVCFGKYATINGDQETHVGFYIDWSKSKDDLLRRDIGFWTKRCEVIGNIHDNPDLLEKNS